MRAATRGPWPIRHLDGDVGAGVGSVQVELAHPHGVETFDDHRGQFLDLGLAGNRRRVAVAGIVEGDHRTLGGEALGEGVEIPGRGRRGVQHDQRPPIPSASRRVQRPDRDLDEEAPEAAGHRVLPWFRAGVGKLLPLRQEEVHPVGQHAQVGGAGLHGHVLSGGLPSGQVLVQGVTRQGDHEGGHGQPVHPLLHVVPEGAGGPGRPSHSQGWPGESRRSGRASRRWTEYPSPCGGARPG